MIAARLSPGAISESSASHLPPSVGSKLAKPVMFPPGGRAGGRCRWRRGRPRSQRRSGSSASPAGGQRLPVCGCYDDVGLQADQLLRECSYPIDVTAAPPKVHPHVAAIGPTQTRKCLRERGEASLRHGIVFVARYEHADAPYSRPLLRPRHRPATPPRCQAPR